MKKLLLLLLFAWGSVCGQTYPAKPVKLIVTYPPGGSSDLMARVFGAKLSELWGQQVIVESKPGAAGSIGMDFAARQPPDGYSFVIGNLGPVAVNPLLSQVPYNIERDFVPVSLISSGPNVLVVRADSAHKSLADIISFARENPGKLNYGTSGPGRDRKSTRLNSSHSQISYAVFCLKKKKKTATEAHSVQYSSN